MTGHADGVLAVRSTPDRRRLASGGFDRTAHICDLTSREKASNPALASQRFSFMFADPRTDSNLGKPFRL